MIMRLHAIWRRFSKIPIWRAKNPTLAAAYLDSLPARAEFPRII